MIYHFKRHLEDLEKTLVVIETQFTEDTVDSTDLKGAVNNFQKTEVWLPKI